MFSIISKSYDFLVLFFVLISLDTFSPFKKVYLFIKNNR